MIKNPKIGQKVWFRSAYVTVNQGKITEICTGKAEGYVTLKGINDTYGTCGAKLEDCFLTKEELLADKQVKNDARIKRYCEEIKTVNDLVTFMYDNNVSCSEEYTDWEAREAARIRAKELLNMDLNE